MASRQPEMVAAVHRAVGAAPTLVDLGAGDGAKAARCFRSMGVSRYVAIDISADFLQGAIANLQRLHPSVEMVGLGLDFSEDLAVPAELIGGPSLLFYPGSSIGNFNRDQALRLLRQARGLCQGGVLLIGVDLVKPKPVLERAYDDALGVTAAFNLNLLRHLNRLLGADFILRQWRHVALYDEDLGRIEMHLQARQALTVSWPGASRSFERGERIHTENSYKWQPAAFQALLREAGFVTVQTWTDPQHWFAVMLAQA
jgi:dimethylhistidine N-methyltransferase